MAGGGAEGGGVGRAVNAKVEIYSGQALEPRMLDFEEWFCERF